MLKRVSVGVVRVVALCVLFSVCGVLGQAPSPKSTYTDASGATVTVDWRDYPAYAGMDGEELVGRPDQSTLEAPARELLQRLRAAVEESSGVRLAAIEPEAGWFGDANWSKVGGNGYGGDSLLVSVDCCTLRSDEAPDPSRWRAVLDAASQVTKEAGLGALELERESEEMAAEPAWKKDHHERFCNLPDGSCWYWVASVYDGSQWVYLTIYDGNLDPTGAGERDAVSADLPVAYIAIEYGATVVEAGKAAEYERALAPFVGIDHPAETTSD
jgi:hypothetical protein